jgi:predicted house-cleaning noncanonical NTP pyrophosphatase (MazG superfamily)
MGKLVRDRIPEIIAAEGRTARVRVLDDEAYDAALLDKLVEEAHELRNADLERRLSEAADVYEVLLAILSRQGLRAADLEGAAMEKRETRGAFAQRLWWEPDK